MKELKKEESKRAAANIRRKLDLESTRYSTCMFVSLMLPVYRYYQGKHQITSVGTYWPYYLAPCNDNSRPANIILYTGLGMAATGMLLISLGAGDHGFKSSYLFVLGPGLLILGKNHTG